MRIGHGYDVHRVVEKGRQGIVLGGVDIPWKSGLVGHSDADVLTHAIMDSILGALALGDIGKHFPNSDPAYKDCSSILLLEQVVELMENKGYKVGNVDTTIIAQQPRLGSYIPSMCLALSKALHCDQDCVSVKATTEEWLGFTGDGSGIAAHAVCLLEATK